MCSSLSMTHGPAISASGAPAPKRMRPPRGVVRSTGMAGLRGHAEPLLAALIGRADERAEERMRLQRLGFELGVKLAAEEPGMVRDLANLDVDAVGRRARDAQSVSGQDFLVLAVELEAVAVAFADLGGAVSA